MTLKVPKIGSFFQFLADLGKKSKTVIASYVYASKHPRFTLLENGIGYYAMTDSLDDTGI